MAVSDKEVSPSELIRTVFEGLNNRDLEGLMPLGVDDLVEDWPTMVGRLEGKVAVRDHFASLFAAFPDFHIEIEQMVAEGETVFVHWHMTGTFTGAAFNGIASTGRRIDLHGTDYFTVRDGKVVSNFIAYDGQDFAVQVGVLPAPGTAAYRVMIAAVNAVTAVRERLRR